MKNINKKLRRARGFTLLELTVSMAIFLFISAVAFRLFSLQQNAATLSRDQVALNLSLRNAMTQIQLDVSNAGSGYFQGVNIPSWPIGLSVINNFVDKNSSCYDGSTGVYGKNCFDQLNIISAADPANFPPVNISDINGGGGCSNTENGVAYAVPTAASGLTLANAAKLFKKNDQLLLLTNNGNLLTTVVLTADASVESTQNKTIVFTFNQTKQLTYNSKTVHGYNTQANDPLDITTCLGNAPCTLATGTPETDKLTNQFCGGDWGIKLAPISYVVCAGPGSPSPCDTSSSSPDIQDPKLERITNTVNSSGNVVRTASVIMDQVIGFKLGATIFNTSHDTSTDSYQYNSACYSTAPDLTKEPCDASQTIDVPYNFSLIRSIRASVIARTSPNFSAAYTFRNTFDGGPYQVQGMTVVVNPRNMSMND